MTPFVQSVTDLLSMATVASDVVIVLLLIIILTPLSERGFGKKIAHFFGKNAILLSFLIALGSVVGSLFYSEYAHFAPCELCWIQRVFLYSQAIILCISLFAKKFRNFTYKACLGLSGIGFIVAAYHTYLQLGGGSIVPCSAIGPSCQYVYFIEYGYVTIPSMALTAFALILIFMLFKQTTEAK
jgi:disulfide bond formation protein DsbB